jgi:hypothetical protein
MRVCALFETLIFAAAIPPPLFLRLLLCPPPVMLASAILALAGVGSLSRAS